MNVGVLKYESDQEYHRQDADKLKIGSSLLRLAVENPYLFERRYINRVAPIPEGKREFAIGHAVEALVFGWGDLVVCSGVKTAGSKAHREAEANHPCHHVLTEDEWDLCHALALEVQGNEDAGIVLSNGRPQVAGRIDQGPFYLQCKHDWLIDDPSGPQRVLMGNGPIVVDFKTTASMWSGYANFTRQVHQFGYIKQAAMYQLIHHAITGEVPSWYWLVVEKEWPREVVLWQADADMMHDARAEVKRDIEELNRRFDEDDFRNSAERVEVIYG